MNLVSTIFTTLLLLTAGTALGADMPESVAANRAAEFTFTSAKAYADPFNEVDVDLIFTTPSGAEMRVPAFWAGGQTWRARYASPEAGDHHFKTVCSDASNAELNGGAGSVKVTPAAGDNPLYLHGPIRVAADKKHFEHADGTPFFWLADTWWMALTKRLGWPADFAALTEDRVEKGFTVVQIIAGLYPDMPAFDERGANEAGFPWDKEYKRINPAYFDMADRRIAYLADHGLAPCIVGAWGYHLPWLGVEKMKKHWRYVIARWGAYPGFWCTAGEGVMPYYLSENKAKDSEFQKHGLTEVAAYIRKIDPFHHPVTIHPSDMSRNQVTDPSVLDFEMLQTGHGDRASIGPTIHLLRTSRAAKPTMPTINSEVCYEGILGTCPAEIQRIMAWTSLLAGTAGHTYGANGIWQVNGKTEPYGKSPHGGNWGNTPWDEAAALPGSKQTGLAKKLLERFDWWKFEPHPEWAAYAPTSDGSSIAWGDWIWFPEGTPTTDAPVAKRWFRKAFNLPADVKIDSALLHLGVDDHLTAFVNSEKIGSQKGWNPSRRYDIAKLLKSGPNVVAIEAENRPGPVSANPAGLLCAGEIVFGGGVRVSLASDARWKSSNAEKDGWKEAGFGDANWSAVKVAAKYGEGPWGQIDISGAAVPIAVAGIPGQVRVIYVPAARAIVLHDLEQDAKWQAEYFDPIIGETKPLPAPVIDAQGAARIEAPAEAQDWVLVLKRQQQ